MTNAGTDLAFSDPVDLLQGVPETTTSPVDQNSKDGLALRNRVIVDSTSERTSESDVSSVLAASGTNSVGKSVRTTTLKAIAVVSLLLSAWFGLNRPAIDSAAMSPAVAEMTAELAVQSPRWDSVAIREIQPAGYKVLADNPQTPGQAPSDFGEFDPNTWRVHRFLMSKPNGGWLKIGLARPVSWIESVERNDSGQVWLEFEELGIADWATLQATEPCPAYILGEGRLVTGTFEHSSGEVLNLFIAGEATPIGSTANHPFWSEDRQDFVQAGSLNPGEHLRLADGRTTTLERTEPIAEQLPVYNLEVDGEHVYFVGESGVLVHNAGDKYPYRPPRRADMDNGVHGPNSPISDAIDRAIRENTRQGKWLSAKAAQKASRAADPTKRVQHVPIDPGDGIEIIPLPNGGGVLIRDATQAFVKQAGNVNHLFPVGPEHVIK